jgi:ribosomal protein S18 acetylase RimI-like enzyme
MLNIAPMNKQNDNANTAADEPRIRALKSQDRSPIENMVISSGKFNEVEVATAMELVDEGLQSGDESGYFFAVLETGSINPTVRGYACYGPVPLTEATYDLYWIVVDPASQGSGFGQRLLKYVEQDVQRRGGRMVLIETSSQESYGATIRFYERSSYALAARIRNFYKMGDDKLIFQKELF